MTERRLRSILDGLDVASDFVVPAPLGDVEQALAVPFEAWRVAAAEARAAYAEWRRLRDGDSYRTYRACADRADAAQDELTARTRARSSVAA